MPYVRMSYIGWLEEWFDNRDPKVDETFIKCYVNRFFALPEDWDADDVPLIMIWVRCVTCGSVSEHFMRETQENWDEFIYNRDNTYTLLSDPECEMCKIPQSYNLTIQEERIKAVVEEYLALFPLKEQDWQFESVLEEYFWKAWQTTFPSIPLAPQYPIGKYRVDFAHVPTKTVIEIDGKQFHTAPYQQTNDKVRQATIEKQGWRFLRFEGGDIFFHVDRCAIETIRFLSQAYGELLFAAWYQWRSSPSARVLTRLQIQYPTMMLDVP